MVLKISLLVWKYYQMILNLGFWDFDKFIDVESRKLCQVHIRKYFMKILQEYGRHTMVTRIMSLFTKSISKNVFLLIIIGRIQISQRIRLLKFFYSYEIYTKQALDSTWNSWLRRKIQRSKHIIKDFIFQRSVFL